MLKKVYTHEVSRVYKLIVLNYHGKARIQINGITIVLLKFHSNFVRFTKCERPSLLLYYAIRVDGEYITLCNYD